MWRWWLPGSPRDTNPRGSTASSWSCRAACVELIDRVCAANPRTVVVLQGGAPMEMPWRDRPAAILLMYLSGCQGGGAAVDVLVGDVNPSGKLAETWPVDLAQTALGTTYPDMDNEVLYREGPFVGYRYYDAVAVEPAFPFGHGGLVLHELRVRGARGEGLRGR